MGRRQTTSRINWQLASMNLNGVEYYYIRNAQGYIIGLFDKTGATALPFLPGSYTAKSQARYKARQVEHARKSPNARYTFQEIGRVKPGRDLDVLEQKMINKYGGLERSGGLLENKRHQISRTK